MPLDYETLTTDEWCELTVEQWCELESCQIDVALLDPAHLIAALLDGDNLASGITTTEYIEGLGEFKHLKPALISDEYLKPALVDDEGNLKSAWKN